MLLQCVYNSTWSVSESLSRLMHVNRWESLSLIAVTHVSAIFHVLTISGGHHLSYTDKIWIPWVLLPRFTQGKIMVNGSVKKFIN